MFDRRQDNGQSPRLGGRLHEVDAMLDGTRTAAEPAAPRPDTLARAEDERLLGWISARLRGEPLSAIALRAGVSPSVVQAKTSAVRNADIDESGEPPLTVGRAYAWGSR